MVVLGKVLFLMREVLLHPAQITCPTLDAQTCFVTSAALLGQSEQVSGGPGRRSPRERRTRGPAPSPRTTLPPRTLQQASVQGPIMVLGGGLFLVSEATFYLVQI